MGSYQKERPLRSLEFVPLVVVASILLVVMTLINKQVGSLPTGGSYIIMEWNLLKLVHLEEISLQSVLGRKLAEMHEQRNRRKALLHVDNTIGRYLLKEKPCGVILIWSNPAPKDAENLSKWELKDAQVMTWILGSVEPHLIINLRPYKTSKDMWGYLKKVYNQDNTARRFQLEYEMANFTQGSLSIEEYFFGFQNLWVEYSDIIHANVPVAALSVVQAVQ